MKAYKENRERKKESKKSKDDIYNSKHVRYTIFSIENYMEQCIIDETKTEKQKNKLKTT